MSELIVISYCLFVAEFALTPSHPLSRSHHHAHQCSPCRGFPARSIHQSKTRRGERWLILFSLDLNAVAYPVNVKDSVVALSDLPRPTAGAGEPVLFASEYLLQIAYYAYGTDDAVALVTFSSPEAHYFGPPHVDAVDRHPLHSRGVDIYGFRSSRFIMDSGVATDRWQSHRGASFHSHVS